MSVKRTVFARLPLLLATLLSASSALAGDGVYEINQTCATQTGCFPGDTAGYPVTIGASGSYRLTSNLGYSGSGTVGIQINVVDVTVDMSGFALICSNVSFPNVNPCSDSPSSAGDAINAPNTVRGVRIQNGVIRGPGGSGIDIGHGAIEKVQVVNAGTAGIRLDMGQVKDCIVEDSAGGVVMGHGLIEGNVISGSSGDSIFANGGTTVRGNSLLGGSGGGIHASFSDSIVLIEGNVIRDHASEGIRILKSAIIRGNLIAENGETGIEFPFPTPNKGLVKDNTIIENGGVGLFVGGSGDGVGYRENVISGNAAGTVTGSSAINLGNNLCDGSVVCP